ncbi:protein angel homolog 1 isoform X1 [Paramormyrops kingsleyae]|uniref:protein angel homolog 1 isoform X1 n=2 Tax=Paramormyrops kingsleyae TaxID=1676925 RepID=UPI003B973E3E
MIGTLMCYVLFPLARVTRAASDRRKKDGPWRVEASCSVMNGKGVWDSEGPVTPRPSEEQSSQQLTTGGSDQEESGVGGGAAQGEQQERVVLAVGGRAQTVDKEEVIRGEVAPEGAVLLPEGSGPESGSKEAKQEGPALEPWGNGCLQKEGLIGVEEQGWESAWDGAGGSDSSGLQYGWAGAGMPSPWGSSTLFSDTGSWAWAGCVQPASGGWHFSSGPGLSQVVHCPPCQAPVMTYNPLAKEMAPFEVTWRVWEDISKTQEPTVGPQGPFEFTVMSYNILAQDLLEANLELYSHCSPGVLAWDFRLRNILLEFDKWKPDIMCLQEVQENHYAEGLLPILTDRGYNCVYKRRTGTKTDGCAVCYQRSRFSQLSARLVEFRRPELALLDRDNVAVVLLLQPVVARGSGVAAQGTPICVANTHLLFNPRRGDVKLAQLAVLLAEIDHAVKPWRSSGSPSPIILCGDFNAVPNMPLYQLITTGQLYYHGLPAWMVSGQEDFSYKMHHHILCAPLWPSELGINDNCQYVPGSKRQAEADSSGRIRYSHSFLLQFRFCEASLVRSPDLDVIPGVTDATPDPSLEKPWNVPRFRNVLHHGLHLQSVYSPHVKGTGRPEVTTLHSNFASTVDYIFYSHGPADARDHAKHRGGGAQQGGGLKLIGRLTLLSQEDLWPMNGLPSEIFSSDHLCLLAKFQLGLDHA